MNREDNIGDSYHLGTKYHRDQRFGGRLRLDEMPEPYKVYSDAEIVSLPEPKTSGGESIWNVLARRRSIRDYSSEPASLDDLSQLLWATQGITARRGYYNFRTSPSAGALYPIETYVIANRVSDLDAGIYHYDVRQHRLEVLIRGYFGSDISRAALGQNMLGESAFVFIWTAIVARSKWKYRERAYRYIYMDAGHIGQNAYLGAEALGLGCCTVGAFFDDEVGLIVGVDGGSEIVIYLCGFGKR